MILYAATDACDWCGEPLGRRVLAYPGNSVLCRSAECRREYARHEIARLRAPPLTRESAASLMRANLAVAVAGASVARAAGARIESEGVVERRLRIAQAVMDGALHVVRAVVGAL